MLRGPCIFHKNHQFLKEVVKHMCIRALIYISLHAFTAVAET